MNALLTNGEAPMDVIEKEKVKTKKTYTNSGHLIAGAAHIEHKPTFTDVSAVICLHLVFLHNVLCLFLLRRHRATSEVNLIPHRAFTAFPCPVPDGRVRDLAHRGDRLHRQQRRPRPALLSALHLPHW